MIQLTQHEQREWARCAQAMYNRGFNELGHKLSVAAAIVHLELSRYDECAHVYRQWLVFDEPKQPGPLQVSYMDGCKLSRPITVY